VFRIGSDTSDPMSISGLSTAARRRSGGNRCSSRYPEYVGYPEASPEEILVYTRCPDRDLGPRLFKGFGHSELMPA
jgi:hypothetical protein